MCNKLQVYRFPYSEFFQTQERQNVFGAVKSLMLLRTNLRNKLCELFNTGGLIFVLKQKRCHRW